MGISAFSGETTRATRKPYPEPSTSNFTPGAPCLSITPTTSVCWNWWSAARMRPVWPHRLTLARSIAVADWLPNVQTKESEAFYQSFRQRFPRPADDYVHMRMQMMVEALAQAIEKAGTVEAVPLAQALEKASVALAGQAGAMRAADHQFQQPLVVGVMDRLGSPGVKFDVEGSGYGFRVVRLIAPAQAEMPHACKMIRP